MATKQDDDEEIRGLWYYVTHPIGALSGLGTLAIALLSDPGILQAIWVATWASIGQVFPLLTIATSTLAPAFPPSTREEWAIILVGGLLFAKTLDTVLKKYDRYV